MKTNYANCFVNFEGLTLRRLPETYADNPTIARQPADAHLCECAPKNARRVVGLAASDGCEPVQRATPGSRRLSAFQHIFRCRSAKRAASNRRPLSIQPAPLDLFFLLKSFFVCAMRQMCTFAVPPNAVLLRAAPPTSFRHAASPFCRPPRGSPVNHAARSLAQIPSDNGAKNVSRHIKVRHGPLGADVVEVWTSVGGTFENKKFEIICQQRRFNQAH